MKILFNAFWAFLAFIFLGSAAFAQNGSFTLSKEEAEVGEAVTVNINLNGLVTFQTSFSVSHTLPSNLVISNPANSSGTCSGSPVPLFSANAGSSSISALFANADLGGTCQFTFDVVASAPGDYDIGPMNWFYSSTNPFDLGGPPGAPGFPGGPTSGPSGTAIVNGPTLTIVPAAPVLVAPNVVVSYSGTFGPSVPVNSGFVLNALINNNVNGTAMSGGSFSVSIDSNSQSNGRPSFNGTGCSATIEADNSSGSLVYNLLNVEIPANGACTFSAPLISDTVGLAGNQVGAITSNLPTTSVQNSTINVVGPPTFSKYFSPSAGVMVDGKTTLFYEMSNVGIPQAISFDDLLPGAASDGLEVASPSNIMSTCTVPGTLSAVPGSKVISEMVLLF